MIDEAGTREALLERIQAKRASIRAFVGELEPRGARLNNLSIISSAVAAALTAGPALGGERFTAGVKGAVGIWDESLVWRSLCLAAMIISIVAAISSNLYKSHEVASRLANAQACNAELEGLETLVQFGQIPVKEAVGLYQQYITRIPFI
jgi:hypothetical protein